MKALNYSSKTYDAKLCLLSHQIMDNPQNVKQEIEALKSILRDKRKYIF